MSNIRSRPVRTGRPMQQRRPNNGGGTSNNNGRRPSNGGDRRGGVVSVGAAAGARDRYMEKGKEALTEGDRVSAENFFQHADHYNRIVIENEERRQYDDSYAKPAEVEPVVGEPGNSAEPVIDVIEYPQANAAVAGDITPDVVL